MNRTVSLPFVLLVLVVLAATVFYFYRRSLSAPPPVNPGAADIPPRRPGDDKPAVPPKDAGPVPGAIPR